MGRKIFVNLPIRDMQRSQAFFKSLGFSFNPQFTNDQGACMVVADATKGTEVLVCLSCDSRAEVDELVRKAVAAGARTPNAPQTTASCTDMASRTWTDTCGNWHTWTRTPRRRRLEGRRRIRSATQRLPGLPQQRSFPCPTTGSPGAREHHPDERAKIHLRDRDREQHPDHLAGQRTRG